jgi:sugar (pentulose or hexulose) kinase
MYACAALTGEPVADIARRWVRPVHAVQPRPEQAEVYAGRFERYRGLYRTLKPVLP